MHKSFLDSGISAARGRERNVLSLAQPMNRHENHENDGKSRLVCTSFMYLFNICFKKIIISVCQSIIPSDSVFRLVSYFVTS